MDKKYFKNTIQIIITLVSFLLTSFLHSQNIDLDTFDSYYEVGNYRRSLIELKKIDTTTISDYDKAIWYFYYADVQSILDIHDIAYLYAEKSSKTFEKLGEKEDALDAKFLKLDILSHQNKLKINVKSILDEIYVYALENEDSIVLRRVQFRYGHYYLGKDNRQKAMYHYQNALDIAQNQKDSLNIAHGYMSLGTLHNTITPFDRDSSLYYAKKAVPLILAVNNISSLAKNYNNQAEAYYYKGDYRKAILYLRKTDSININKNDKKTRIIFYENLAKNYDSIKDYKNATLYYRKFIQLTDSINDVSQNINIADIIEKYESAELRADNAKTNTYLTIALAILALVIISAYLLQKNTRKKQLLAEQAKDLEAQKVENLLQEQELASIDAMIEGQEKERKRIAEDLHDDLGALMATINLHLENVGSENNPNALSKTKTLLAEAYSKIRNLSHVKNAGVIANEGLLVAVKNMASKISSANKIDIEVIAHGLENRLENSLELSLFRTIQELITNSIKHAEATKATIQLTQFENSLNIIVEDNGKGFNVNELSQKGIGLNNIKKRMEHLEGTLTIDSTIGRGTTIVVDVPLQT